MVTRLLAIGNYDTIWIFLIFVIVMEESALLDKIEQKIRSGAKAKGIPLFELAERIGISETGFYVMLRKQAIKVKTLIQISDTLGMPLKHFFSEEESKPISSRREEIKFLKEKATLLHKLIETQKDMIMFLEKAGK
jgi:transcriptional regulator with XRE-family HTH domain